MSREDSNPITTNKNEQMTEQCEQRKCVLHSRLHDETLADAWGMVRQVAARPLHHEIASEAVSESQGACISWHRSLHSTCAPRAQPRKGHSTDSPSFGFWASASPRKARHRSRRLRGGQSSGDQSSGSLASTLLARLSAHSIGLKLLLSVWHHYPLPAESQQSG